MNEGKDRQERFQELKEKEKEKEGKVLILIRCFSLLSALSGMLAVS